MIAQIPHAADLNDVMSAVEAMRVQEEAGYQCVDYLSQVPAETSTLPVNEECRRKMTEWCYQVVDYCKFSRETVAIAMSLIDRYLCSKNGQEALVNRKLFQLASMTSLYTAVKVHEPEAMEPKTIAGLSRGAYTEEQVTKMELDLLAAVGWKLNPPLAFVQHCLALLPDGCMSMSDKEAILEVAKFQTELALDDYSLVKVNASTIALAAVGNALSSLNVDMAVQQEFLGALTNLLRIKPQSDELRETQMKLLKAMHSSTFAPRTQLRKVASTMKMVQANQGAVQSSPRCVTSS